MKQPVRFEVCWSSVETNEQMCHELAFGFLNLIRSESFSKWRWHSPQGTPEKKRQKLKQFVLRRFLQNKVFNTTNKTQNTKNNLEGLGEVSLSMEFPGSLNRR